MADTRCYGGVRLRRVGETILPHSPLLVASADIDVVADHGDIFNPVFIDFLVSFVAASDYKRSAWTNGVNYVN
jgi:hypothetical protein